MEVFGQVLRIAGTGMAALVGIWGFYYLITGLMSWRKPTDYGQHAPQTRFAVLIAARNEESVIAELVHSLHRQRYSSELYDIWVIPNNCTDHTAQAAKQAGAKILECPIPVHCKGKVLTYAFQQLFDCGYDAFCVFDADNLVHEDFLAEMNNAACWGAEAAQGYRDSKNPGESLTAGCSSIYYWMMNRFHNSGKAGMNLSAMINGTGFMITAKALDRLDGWKTETLSEDLELSALCTMAQIPICWVPLARTYDEQPLTAAQSIRQRKRWSSGTIQVAERYLPKIGRNLSIGQIVPLADLSMTLLIPAYQIAVVLSTMANLIGVMLHGEDGQKVLFSAALFLAGNLVITVLISTLTAAAVLTLERKWSRSILGALLMFWLFLLSWLPITVESFWKKTTTWEEVHHTSSIRAEMVLSQNESRF